MRGDAVLYIRKRKGADDDGFHTPTSAVFPRFVYRDLAETLDNDWTVTLSHEALELVGDAVARKRLDLKNGTGVGRGHRRRLKGGTAGV